MQSDEQLAQRLARGDPEAELVIKRASEADNITEHQTEEGFCEIFTKNDASKFEEFGDQCAVIE